MSPTSSPPHLAMATIFSFSDVLPAHVVPGAMAMTADHRPDAQRWNEPPLAEHTHAPSVVHAVPGVLVDPDEEEEEDEAAAAGAAAAVPALAAEGCAALGAAVAVACAVELVSVVAAAGVAATETLW